MRQRQTHVGVNDSGSHWGGGAGEIADWVRQVRELRDQAERTGARSLPSLLGVVPAPDDLRRGWFIDPEDGQAEASNNRVRARADQAYYTCFLPGFQGRGSLIDGDLVSTPEGERGLTVDESRQCVDERREPDASGRHNPQSMALTLAVGDSARAGEEGRLSRHLEVPALA